MATIVASGDTPAAWQAHFDVANPDGTTAIVDAGGSTANVQPRRLNLRDSTTPSNNVGPNGPQAGTFYLYSEATSPTVAGDIFELTLRERTDEVISQVDFWTNTRTGGRGTLAVDSWDGSSWVREFTLGPGGGPIDSSAEPWVQQQVIFASPRPRFRFQFIMDGTGNVWHGDIGLDTVSFETQAAQTFSLRHEIIDSAGNLLNGAVVAALQEVGGVWVEQDRVTTAADGIADFEFFDGNARTLIATSADGTKHGFYPNVTPTLDP